jgi:tetratricopeptide (TPR) repeat protein
MALNKDRVFKAAENYIKKNKVDKAIGEYESWLKENPKDWNIIRTVGDLYARISRNDEAIKKYAQVADHYRKDGFNVRAIATYKMVLRLDPQNEPAMRNLAELQSEEGLLMEAKSYYQTLVESITSRSLAPRRRSLREARGDRPQDVKIRYKYADFLNTNGKPDEAAREYVGIADAFIGQGLVEEAIKILEQGRSLQTSDPALKIKLAQACTMQGNHGQAIRLLEEVRRSAAGDPAILGRLGLPRCGQYRRCPDDLPGAGLGPAWQSREHSPARRPAHRPVEARYRSRGALSPRRSLRLPERGYEGDGAPVEGPLEGPVSYQDPPQARGNPHHPQAGVRASGRLRQSVRGLQPRRRLPEGGLGRGAVGGARPRELAAQGSPEVPQIQARRTRARPRTSGQAGSPAAASGGAATEASHRLPLRRASKHGPRLRLVRPRLRHRPPRPPYRRYRKSRIFPTSAPSATI